MNIGRDTKTLAEMKKWLKNNSVISDKGGLREELVLNESLEGFVGKDNYHWINKEKGLRFYIIVLLRGKTVLLNGSIHSDYVIPGSIRVPNQGDKEVLEPILKTCNEKLKQKELERKYAEATSSNEKKDKKGVRLKLLESMEKLKISGIDREINLLYEKIYFIQSAIREATDIHVEKYSEGNQYTSLYYSQEELEKIKLNQLEEQLKRYTQLVNIKKELYKDEYRDKTETCPACNKEGTVLETEMGLVNPHYYQERVCHFCWGSDNPFNKYISMSLEQFENHLETVFQEQRVKYYRIWQRQISKRSRVKVKYISFNSRYNMMPAVTEVYNVIFIILALKEYTNNKLQDVNEKILADVLNTIRSPLNRELFLTSIFPFLDLGFYSYPKLNYNRYPIDSLIERYKEMVKVEEVLDHYWKVITTKEEGRLFNKDALEKFEEIEPSLVLEFKNGYNVLIKLIRIKHYMDHSGMKIEDYEESDSIKIPDVMYFCKTHPESPFIDKKLNEEDIRKWIKCGSLVGKKQGSYYVQVKDLLLFFQQFKEVSLK